MTHVKARSQAKHTSQPTKELQPDAPKRAHRSKQDGTWAAMDSLSLKETAGGTDDRRGLLKALAGSSGAATAEALERLHSHDRSALSAVFGLSRAPQAKRYVVSFAEPTDLRALATYLEVPEKQTCYLKTSSSVAKSRNSQTLAKMRRDWEAFSKQADLRGAAVVILAHTDARSKPHKVGQLTPELFADLLTPHTWQAAQITLFACDSQDFAAQLKPSVGKTQVVGVKRDQYVNPFPQHLKGAGGLQFYYARDGARRTQAPAGADAQALQADDQPILDAFVKI